MNNKRRVLVNAPEELAMRAAGEKVRGLLGRLQQRVPDEKALISKALLEGLTEELMLDYASAHIVHGEATRLAREVRRYIRQVKGLAVAGDALAACHPRPVRGTVEASAVAAWRAARQGQEDE